MKNFTFLFVFLINFFVIQAQDITIYGFLPSAPNTDFLRLAHFDPITGNIVDEDSISPATAYALGSSTFDAVKNAFMFIGVDTAWNFRLYSREISTKTTLSDPVFNKTLNDLQYDMNSMNTYGLGSYISDSILIDTLIGLWDYEYATRFMQIDQNNGTLTELNQMPDITAFPAGSSTFDANNSRYIVNAYDTTWVELLVIIDAETGDIFSKDPIGLNPGDYLNNLEYNNEDDKIYGFYRGSNNTFYALISIDIYKDFKVDTIYTFTDLQYFIQGGAVFHQASQNYIMYYIDANNINRTAVIDVTTGNLTANPIASESITEIEVNNTEYALAKYHETVGFYEETESVNEFKVYPNPASSGGSLFYQGSEKPAKISIYNPQGVMIYQSKEIDSNGLVGLGKLSPGVYLVNIQTNTKIETHRLVVQ